MVPTFQDDKHQLFLTLKKVLNEDETRRRKETDEMNIMYGTHSTPVLPIAGKGGASASPQVWLRNIEIAGGYLKIVK